MQLAQRWWNGRYGRLARRDIWLEQHEVWRVRVRKGDGDSPTRTWTFDTRKEAEDLVQRLLAAEPTNGWRDITAVSTNTTPQRPQRP